MNGPPPEPPYNEVVRVAFVLAFYIKAKHFVLSIIYCYAYSLVCLYSVLEANIEG